MAGVTTLKRTDSPSPSNHQVPTVPKVGEGLQGYISPFSAGVLSNLDMLSQPLYVPCVHLACCVWKIASLKSSSTTSSYCLSAYPLRMVSEPWREGCGMDIPLRSEGSIALTLCRLTSCGYCVHCHGVVRRVHILWCGKERFYWTCACWFPECWSHLCQAPDTLVVLKWVKPTSLECCSSQPSRCLLT